MVKNKSFALLVVLLLVAACSHTGLNTNLKHLEGQNIERAISYLGLPDDKYTIGDKGVYVWGGDAARYNEKPVTTFGGYNSNGGLFGGVGIVFGGPSLGNNNYRYYCSIKALTNAQEIIEKMEHESRAGGCSKYNDGLRALEKDNVSD